MQNSIKLFIYLSPIANFVFLEDENHLLFTSNPQYQLHSPGYGRHSVNISQMNE